MIAVSMEYWWNDSCQLETSVGGCAWPSATLPVMMCLW
jgi:hypothetical protein